MNVSDFQSLAQLAVAMNVGFTAVAAFAGTAVSREREQIDLLFESGKALIDHTNEQNEDRKLASLKQLRAVIQLRADATELERQQNWLFTEVAKWIALGAAIIAFILLIAASFGWQGMVNWVAFGSIVVNLPFLFAVAFAAFISTTRVGPLRTQRVNLDKALSEACA